MKKIGFKNFRRFNEFKPIELGEITFLVGRNNSGKSTLVKAILLIIEYLKSRRAGEFRFDGNALYDANVVSFKRTKNNKSDSDIIEFMFSIANFDCFMKITGSDFDTTAQVVEFNMKNNNYGFDINFSFTGSTIVKINREFGDDQTDSNIEIANDLLERLKTELELIDKENLREYASKKAEIELQEKRIAAYLKTVNSNTRNYKVDYYLQNKCVETAFLDMILKEVIAINLVKTKEISPKTDGFHHVKSFDDDKSLILGEMDLFINAISNINLSYFGAESFKQPALFSLKDTNNSLAQAIHQFYQLKADVSSPEKKFVIKWMNEFEIGGNFEITPFEGEAYKLEVFEGTDLNYPINLSDKGMGSLQAMKLLLRIAKVINKVKNLDRNDVEEIILSEESELNLHPALQSKIADLIYEVNKQFGIKFIIETHSEYIIRRSQVIGLKNKLVGSQEINNPFKVYCFSLKGEPYEMKYTQEGRFDRNFEEGFLDAATNSSKELFILNQG